MNAITHHRPLPVPFDPTVRRPRARRLAQLLTGLVLYGFSMSLMVRAGLGLDPWDVLHQGLARHTGISIGTWVILAGAAVLLLWIPLRQRPGVGTVANVVLIGLALDAALAVLPSVHGLAQRVLLMLAAVLLNGIATGLYVGAGLGPGPRDGLMTGLAKRVGTIRSVRTGIELTVLATGWLLGGTVGVGTVLYAVAIGPLAHVFIPRFTIRAADGTADGTQERSRSAGLTLVPAATAAGSAAVEPDAAARHRQGDRRLPHALHTARSRPAPW